MAITGAANAASSAAAAPTQQTHPDASDFDIPMLADPKNGFGGALENACNLLKPRTVSVPGPNGHLAAAPPPDAANVVPTLQRAMRRNPEVAALAQAMAKLKEICAAIADGQAIDEPQLDALRQFEDSGVFPALVTALTSVAGDAETAALPADKLAAAMMSATGMPQGELPTGFASGFESNLLNGLADFLVTRSKEEAILYLQGEIANRFCKADGARLLPSTCRAIKDLDPGLSIAAIGNALNAAARRDLAALPDGLLQVSADKDPNHLYVYEPLRMAYAVGLAARDGRLPLELARSLHALAPRASESTPEPSAADRSTQEVFRALRVASALIYSAQASSVDQLAGKLGAHPELVVGVLLETESRYSSAFGTERRRILSPTSVHALAQVLHGMASVLPQWQQHQNALKTNDGKSTSTDRKHMLGTAVFESIQRVSELTRKIATNFVTDPVARGRVLSTATTSRDLAAVAKDLANEDYGAIAIDAAALSDDLSKGSDIPDAMATLLRTGQKYVPLVAELAAAKSSADVSTALQAAAAPATSYRAKYQRGQIALNGLVGVMLGAERPNQPNNAALGSAQDSAVVSGFAPIGLEGTIPLSSSFYAGLMTSVLDLGALTTARFKSDASTGTNVRTDPNVTIGQVFSPGGYVVFGLFNSPLVLGGGISYTPSLRTLQATDATGSVTATEKLSTVRIGGFLAADVTLLPL
jgi:hypothetical protein